MLVTWDEGAAKALTSEALRARFGSGQRQGSGGTQRWQCGDRAGRRSSVEAEYELPFLAHATMELQNCTADVRADRCVIWAPTQFQAGDRCSRRRCARRRHADHRTVAGEIEVPRLSLVAGSDGVWNPTVEAVQLSKAVGVPVKVVWTREDDMQHDVYRPMSYHKLSAGLNAGGEPVARRHRVVAPSIISRFIPGWLPQFVGNMLSPMKGGIDEGSSRVLAINLTRYRINSWNGSRPIRRFPSDLALGRILIQQLRSGIVRRRTRARGEAGSLRVPSQAAGCVTSP